MKRIAIALLVGVGLFSILCIALALAVTLTPLRAQLGQAIERVAELANLNFNFDSRAAPGAGGEADAAGEEGVLVVQVLDGSPAQAAGLRRGDIILAVNEQPVNALDELVKALMAVNSGDQVELSVQRGDARQTLTLTAGKQAGVEDNPLLGIVPYSGDLGMRGFGSLPGMGMTTGEGVQITSVVEGSPAESAGLQAGEWIRAVNGEEVSRPQEVTRIIQQRQPGDALTLTVENPAGEQREVSVTLAQKPDGEQAWLGVSLSPGLAPLLPGMGPGRGGQGGPMDDHLPILPDGYEAGAVVMEVTPGSPAGQAGLQIGQVILAVNGEKVASADALKATIAGFEPGDEVTLTVSGPDDAAAQELSVTLGENPDQAGAAYLGIRFGFFALRPELAPGGPVN